MIEFCHISPTKHLDDFCKHREYHLTLAHLVQSDKQYLHWYKENTGVDTVNIMDNSCFELYKQNKPLFEPSSLVDLGKQINADYIVLPDYPNENADKTIAAAQHYAPVFHDNGFGSFFVPQSPIGDINQLIDSFQWAVESDLVDYIGISILAVPNAYRVESNNKLQRFCSRWSFLNTLHGLGILDQAIKLGKKFHMLGMVDGPKEITLVREFSRYITSWDSSAAVWAGLNNIRFDDSPTGLINGKYEHHVDFSFHTTNKNLIDIANYNIKYIDCLLSDNGV